MPRSLPDGIYEHPVTDDLAAALSALEPFRASVVRDLGDDDAPAVLARHLGQEAERVLRALPRAARSEAARRLVSELLRVLATLTAGEGADADADPEGILAQRLAAPARQLLAIHRGPTPVRPVSPLGISTLLTRNRHEPALGHELACEVTTADRIDAVVAFVTVGGVRSVRDALEGFARKAQGDQRMRLLTTTFTGTTEVEALDMLARLPGVSVKVSYDVRRTRLHAKAWLFHRDTGLSTAYVGSANLTATALGAGQEWMVKISAAELDELKALEQRILAGKAPMISAETVLRQTLRDLRRARRA